MQNLEIVKTFLKINYKNHVLDNKKSDVFSTSLFYLM